MSQKILTLVLICACVLAITIPLTAQDASSTRGILGYLDPKTGTFHILPVPNAQDGAPPPTSTVTGKIVANFTITVDSTIASTAKIGCNISASVLDVTTGNSIIEEAGSAVTRGTGATVTCTATIPYSWTLGAASTDKVNLSYTIQSPVAVTSGSALFPNRLSSQSLGTISVPATGTTTTETIAATI